MISFGWEHSRQRLKVKFLWLELEGLCFKFRLHVFLPEHDVTIHPPSCIDDRTTFCNSIKFVSVQNVLQSSTICKGNF